MKQFLKVWLYILTTIKRICRLPDIVNVEGVKIPGNVVSVWVSKGYLSIWSIMDGTLRVYTYSPAYNKIINNLGVINNVKEENVVIRRDAIYVSDIDTDTVIKYNYTAFGIEVDGQTELTIVNRTLRNSDGVDEISFYSRKNLEYAYSLIASHDTKTSGRFHDTFEDIDSIIISSIVDGKYNFSIRPSNFIERAILRVKMMCRTIADIEDKSWINF